MTEHYRDIDAVLGAIRRRWRTMRVLEGAARAAVAAAAVLLLAFGVWTLTGGGGTALLVDAAIALPAALAAIGWGLWRAGRVPSDRQVARLIEEHHPELEDRLVSAVEFGSETAQVPQTPLVDLLVADAARRAEAIDTDTVISRQHVRRSAGLAALAVVMLAASAVTVREPARRAYDLAMFALFPSHLTLQVTPGDARVRAGDPLEIAVTLPAHHGGLVPQLAFGAGDRWRQAAMQPPKGGGTDGHFVLRFPSVTSAFSYRVAAGTASSPQYTVTVLHPPHVARIDLRYEYPSGLGLSPRTDPDSGDIYAPPGTRVHLHVTTDKPVTSGAITLGGGQRLTLDPVSPKALDGEIDVQQDGAYRVALADTEGLQNPGDTEYFIRMLAHRPPDVRIVRPARDRQVTSLEEVDIDAHADAEYGIRSFNLVYAVRGGPEHAVPFSTRHAAEGGTDGRRELSLENLKVKPGDLRQLLRQGPRPDAQRRGRRSPQRHLLPRGPAVRGDLYCRAEPDPGALGRAEPVDRRSRRGAEGHRRGDLEARPAVARGRPPVGAGREVGRPGAGRAEDPGGGADRRVPRRDDARSHATADR